MATTFHLVIYPPGTGGGKTRVRHGATLRTKETVTAAITKYAAENGYRIATRGIVPDKIIDSTYANTGEAKKAAEGAGFKAVTYQFLIAKKAKG